MSDLFEQFSQAEKVPIVEPVNVAENSPPPEPAPTEALIASADCPARVHRIVQPLLFDCSQQYQ